MFSFFLYLPPKLLTIIYNLGTTFFMDVHWVSCKKKQKKTTVSLIENKIFKSFLQKIIEDIVKSLSVLKILGLLGKKKSN